MKEIRFVDVGEGITEGHIRKWLVADGAKVQEDQSLVQVETDKAVVNVPAPVDGIVRIIAKEGTTVHVGDYVALVGTQEELAGAKIMTPQPSAAAPAARTITQAGAAPSQDEAPKKEIMATPYVRKLAHELHVDINGVSGTGPNGRIVENDIRASASKASAPRAAPKFSEVLEESHGEGIERIPLGTTRKAIARNMEAALSIPSAVNMELIDATALDGIVRREKRRAMDDRKVKLTMLPFVIKATIEALKENPNFNASYDHERLEIIRKNYYNIGIAAEAPDGLKVFVIRNADTKGILELAKEIQELGGKVRDQTITLDEMRDSSFTITNIGSLGGGFLAVPIINHPDVAILGVMLAKKMPVVVEDMVKIGMVLPVSLVFDHRVVDGAEAVRFTNSLKKYLEDPEFLEML